MKKVALLTALALIGGGVVVSATSCGTPAEQEVVTKLDTFKGSAKVNGVDTEVKFVMDLDAKTFEIYTKTEADEEPLLAGSGSFELEANFGYTFFISKEGTPCVSTYNEETKSHEFVYNLKAKDADGKEVKIPVNMSMKDETFEKVTLNEKEQFVRNVTFKAYVLSSTRPADPQMGPVSDVVKLTFDHLGNAKVRGFYEDEKGVEDHYSKDGTYTFLNNTFTVKIGDKEYKSTFNLQNRDYTIKIDDITFKFNPNEIEDTIKGNNMSGFGPLDTRLYMYSNGKAFLDITTKMKSMNRWVDEPDGEWTEAENGDRNVKFYIFDRKENKRKLDLEIDVIKQADGTYKSEFTKQSVDGGFKISIAGPMNRNFDLAGSDTFGADAVAYSTVFTSDTEAVFKVMGKMPIEPTKFTYTFADNIITLKDGDKEIKSTWNEEKGEYKADIPYSIAMGPQTMDLTAHLSYQVW